MKQLQLERGLYGYFYAMYYVFEDGTFDGPYKISLDGDYFKTKEKAEKMRWYYEEIMEEEF